MDRSTGSGKACSEMDMNRWTWTRTAVSDCLTSDCYIGLETEVPSWLKNPLQKEDPYPPLRKFRRGWSASFGICYLSKFWKWNECPMCWNQESYPARTAESQKHAKSHTHTRTCWLDIVMIYSEKRSYLQTDGRYVDRKSLAGCSNWDDPAAVVESKRRVRPMCQSPLTNVSLGT